MRFGVSKEVDDGSQMGTMGRTDEGTKGYARKVRKNMRTDPGWNYRKKCSTKLE